MMLLHDQDRETIIEYTGQSLYSMMIIGPQKTPLGFNLYIEGSDEILGTFDSLSEATSEINSIRGADQLEYFVSGHSSYDGVNDFESIESYVDCLSDGEYNHEMD